MNSTITRYILILLFILMATSAAATNKIVHLSSAASLTPVMQQLIDHYQTLHPDQTVLANMGASGSLAKQIIAGATTDLYISANAKWITYLDQKGVIAHQTIIPLTHNTLVCAGAPNPTLIDLKSLTTVRRIALGNPTSAPVGEYARKALQAKQLYQPLQEGGKLVFAKDVRQAIIYAEQELVDAILVYATDVTASTKIEVLFTVPVQLYPAITYPMALTLTGQHSQQAQQFYQFLSSNKAQQILHHHGFQ